MNHLQRCHKAFLESREKQITGRENALLETLTHVAARLQDLGEGLAHTTRPDTEGLEVTLNNLDILVANAMRESLSQPLLASERNEAERQLRPLRNRIAPSEYEQMLDRLIMKRLREEWGIPYLSLFHL